MVPTYGLSCHLCNDVLISPVMVSRDPRCDHIFHKQCFKLVFAEKKCPQCSVIVTSGIENSAIEKIACKMDALAKEILSDPSLFYFPQHCYFPNFLRYSVFYRAIEQGDTKLVEFHITNMGFLVSGIYGGFSPLYLACRFNQLSTARLLLHHGAKSTQRNECDFFKSQTELWYHSKEVTDYGTPIHAAVRYGSVELLHLLKVHHASLDELDQNGHTPLYIAVQLADPVKVKFLLEAGANLSIGYDGGNILMIAKRRADEATKFYYSYCTHEDSNIEIVNSKAVHSLIEEVFVQRGLV